MIDVDEVVVEMFTVEGARFEIERLLREVGMSREELGRRGALWELDAYGRGVLQDVEGFEFLIRVFYEVNGDV